MTLPSLTPGVVKSYDANRRMCRVEIPGLTDGCEVFPEAEFCSAMGDKSEHTEIHIIAGDRVWLSFIDGDPRYPVIMGYRPKNTGNSNGVRRWHHAGVEIEAFTNHVSITAKTNVVIEAKTSDVTVKAAGNVVLQCGQNLTATVGGAATLNVTGALSATAESISLTAGSISLSGSVSISGGSLTHNGTNVGSSHRHDSVLAGPDMTGGPS